MRTSFYDRIPDSFGLLAADLIPLDELKKEFLLTRINVPEKHRGKGFGSALLKKVTDEADRCYAVIHLEVVPSGPLNAAALQEWYERNGFFRVAPSPTERSSAIKMWRPPNPYGERLLRSGRMRSES